jgi:hypothetical protein
MSTRSCLAPPTDEARRFCGRAGWSRNALEEIVRRAAQVLGVLTRAGDGGGAGADELVMERLSGPGLQQASRWCSTWGGPPTIFVGSRRASRPWCGSRRILNWRLAGLTLSRIGSPSASGPGRRPSRGGRAAEHLRGGAGDLRPVRRHWFRRARQRESGAAGVRLNARMRSLGSRKGATC